MIAGDHDDLDPGGAALDDGVGNGGTRRVDHRHETDEAQADQREVLLVAVERVADGKLLRRQEIVAEAEHAFAESAQFEVGLVELVAPDVVEGDLFAVDEDRRTAVEDALRCALHDEQVAFVGRVVQFVDRYLTGERTYG